MAVSRQDSVLVSFAPTPRKRRIKGEGHENDFHLYGFASWNAGRRFRNVCCASQGLGRRSHAANLRGGKPGSQPAFRHFCDQSVQLSIYIEEESDWAKERPHVARRVSRK